LNAFTDSVLYLDVFTHKMEQYVGNYFDVVKDITARVEKENRKNAQLAKEIQENKDKASKRISGENNPNSKFTKEIIDEVIRLRKEGHTYDEITKITGVSKSRIGVIVNSSK
jgi:DNA invertase Pin-like site-specific DNA recombinase